MRLGLLGSSFFVLHRGYSEKCSRCPCSWTYRVPFLEGNAVNTFWKQRFDFEVRVTLDMTRQKGIRPTVRSSQGMQCVAPVEVMLL